MFSLLAASSGKVTPEEYSWRILEQAQVFYDNGKFGEALNLAIKAKENRQRESSYEFDILEKALTPRQVTRVGTHFDDVLVVLKERDEAEAVSIINYYLDLHGSAYFDESVSSLAEWIKNKGVYPEADYLIGKIYQLEGEYATAEKYYESAFKNSSFLDIPEQKTDILYSQAALARDMNKTDDYEKYLILIISRDPHFEDRVLLDSFLRTIKADRKENVDRFFLLYRSESKMTLNALYEITELYERQKQTERSLECACLGAVEGFTHMHEALLERDSDYKYGKFEDFLIECTKYPDIAKWASDNHVWEFFFLMADKAGNSGSLVFASKMFSTLSNACPDRYWSSKAGNRLIK